MWQLPYGAKLVDSNSSSGNGSSPEKNSTEFRLWANRAHTVNLQIVLREVNQARKQEQIVRSVPMVEEAPGVFFARVPACPAGTLYRFQLDGNEGRPDPYSRFQPFGVHGPSQVIDPAGYRWNDSGWLGIAKRDLVIYELHLGSFTDAGTYLAAIERLPYLVELGVNAIELLPLAQSPGRWNWGYDGVNYFAPRNTFGTPDELRAFIDAAHHCGLTVIHDVVYNHVGPEGNYLNEFSDYRSAKYGTPWGDSLNFDRPEVREFVIQNGLYWLDEFHFDGLRLDAIHYMFDDLTPHIVSEFASEFRKYGAKPARELHLIAESNIFDPELLPGAGNQAGEGTHYDAIWSDCLMHSLYSHGRPDLRLTNRHYQGTADVVEALNHAYVFATPNAARVTAEIRQRFHPGEERDYKSSLIMALQTHDSVGNHPHGKRLHQLIDRDFQRAAAPLILLYPSIPMIFMGEECAAEAPFPFFADFEDPQLRQAVDRGRQEEYPHHDWSGSPLPSDPLAFYNSKFNLEQTCNLMLQWYQQILALRRWGIRDGWLNAANKRTSYDADQHIFSLIFDAGQQRITIASRLAQPDSAPARLKFRSPAKLLLDSLRIEARPLAVDLLDSLVVEEQLELQPKHCCVWLEIVR